MSLTQKQFATNFYEFKLKVLTAILELAFKNQLAHNNLVYLKFYVEQSECGINLYTVSNGSHSALVGSIDTYKYYSNEFQQHMNSIADNLSNLSWAYDSSHDYSQLEMVEQLVNRFNLKDAIDYLRTTLNEAYASEDITSHYYTWNNSPNYLADGSVLVETEFKVTIKGEEQLRAIIPVCTFELPFFLAEELQISLGNLINKYLEC